MMKQILLASWLSVYFIYSGNAHADSQQMRKKSALSLNYHGLSGNFLKHGTSIAYSFGPRFELSLNALQGQVDIRNDYLTKDEIELYKLTGTDIYEMDANGAQYTLNSRYFFGNSASLILGAGLNKHGVDFGISDKELKWSASTSSSCTEYPIFLGLGNQWTFDSGFNLGFDWQWITATYGQKCSFSTKTVGLTSQQQETLEEVMNTLSGSLIYRFMPFVFKSTLGYRF